MERRLQLIRHLADGRFHSGESLANEAGISRVAVWKHIKVLRDRYGLSVHAVRGRGYRLASPVELLDLEEIQGGLLPSVARKLSKLTLHDSVDSTSSWLMRRSKENPPSGWACISEHQTHGRGRHGRHWVSPFGSSVYLSLLWRFALTPMELQGLSLAVGVAVRRALHEKGITDVALKWPNDIELNGGKLAGVLLEMAGEAEGPSTVVIGVGVNVWLPRDEAEKIDRPWADMSTCLKHTAISRNSLVAGLINHLVDVLLRFEESRFVSFMEEWMSADPYVGEQVVLVSGAQRINGIHCGIDRDGALLLNTDGRIQRFVAGEVSLRTPV